MAADESMKQENVELRIAKNLLIDRVEEQDTELQKKDSQIASMQEEMLQLKKQAEQYEQTQKKMDRKEKRKMLRESLKQLRNKIEGVMYSAAYVIFFFIFASIIGTIVLNAELRNAIWQVIKMYVLGG